MNSITMKHEDGSETVVDISGPDALYLAAKDAMEAANAVVSQLPNTPETDAFLIACMNLSVVLATRT